MNDYIVALEYSCELLFIANIPFYKGDGLLANLFNLYNGFCAGVRKVVINSDIVSFFEQFYAGM